MSSKYLKKHKIATLEFPLYSPDLNPIENIWEIMVGKLRKKYFNTIRVNRVSESWVGKNWSRANWQLNWFNVR